ncbi:MAG: hypothetical protein Q9175_005209 [Cornicularia normoerica]
MLPRIDSIKPYDLVRVYTGVERSGYLRQRPRIATIDSSNVKMVDGPSVSLSENATSGCAESERTESEDENMSKSEREIIHDEDDDEEGHGCTMINIKDEGEEEEEEFLSFNSDR